MHEIIEKASSNISFEALMGFEEQSFALARAHALIIRPTFRS